MNSKAAELERRPRPPRIGPLIAVALELGMLGTFCVDRSIVGIVLWFSYAWFSATWQLLAGGFDRDEP